MPYIIHKEKLKGNTPLSLFRNDIKFRPITPLPEFGFVNLIGIYI